VVLRGAAGSLLASGVVSFIGGCASPPGAPTPAAGEATPLATASSAAATATPAAKLGGVFRHPIVTDTGTLDPHQNVQAGLLVWGPGIAYSKLLQYKIDGAVKPGQLIPTGDLAESWEQADSQTYVFRLRRGVKFQNIAPVNGREVVAADVKYSFERQIALKTNAARLAGVSRIDAVDPYTVKISLAKPDADFLVSLAQFFNKVIPHESVEVKGDLAEGPIIGCGPWIFEKWERNSIATLTRNPDYYLKGFPRVDRIEFPRVLDASTRQAAFRAQQADALPSVAFSPKDGERIRQANPNEIILESAKSYTGDSLSLNASKPPLNDRRLRQAIFKAIDKQAIMDAVLDGKGWYFPGVVVPGDDYLLPEDELRAAYKQDLPAARRLLAEVGLPPGTEFEGLVSQSRESILDMAQLVKAQLANVGITVNLKPIDTPTSQRIVFQEQSHQMFFGALAVAVTANGDLFNAHHSSGGQNRGAIKDPALDAMIERQATMFDDPAGRKKILLDIQRYIVNSAHQIVIYGLFDNRLRWKYVQDWFFASVIEEPFRAVWLDR
jgi:ABC-type transport system substrate-binding protein